MRSVAGLVCLVAFALGSSVAFAQTTTAPSAGAKPGQPGIDVYSPIYPRPPSPDVVQSTANLPVQPTDPTTPYPPVGIASNNLIWYPAVTGGAFYDDNVFASNSNRQSDWAGFVRPELGWRTNNWANMEAAGTAFVEQRWYDKFSSETSSTPVPRSAAPCGRARTRRSSPACNICTRMRPAEPASWSTPRSPGRCATTSSKAPAPSTSATAGCGPRSARQRRSSISPMATSPARRSRRTIATASSPASRRASAMSWRR